MKEQPTAAPQVVLIEAVPEISVLTKPILPQ